MANRQVPKQAGLGCRTEAVSALLRRGADIEARDGYLRTAFILCARERGQAATGRVLIEAGADANTLDKLEDGALSLAAWRGKGDFVDLLLEKGARVPESGEECRASLSMVFMTVLGNLQVRRPPAREAYQALSRATRAPRPSAPGSH